MKTVGEIFTRWSLFVALISTMVAPFSALENTERSSTELVSQVGTTGKFNSIKKVDSSSPSLSSDVSGSRLADKIPDLVANSTISESTKPFEKRM